MKTPAIHTPGRAHYEVHTVTTYEGTAPIYGPPDRNPGVGSIERITCGHRHDHPDKATECAERKARAEANRRNRADTPAYAAIPCRITIHTEEGAYGAEYDQPGYLIHCSAHHSMGSAGNGHLHKSMEDAIAAIPAFTCPWAKIAPKNGA